METNGNREPHSVPSGACDAGPVVPWHPPSMFGTTMNQWSVSNGAPGPTMPVHHPAVGWPGPAGPITWLSPVRAWATRMALPRSAARSPNVSYAMRTDGSSPPRSSTIGPTDANRRSAGGSPSRHAPVTGGLPAIAFALASLTKLAKTASSGVCQSIAGKYR